MTIQNFGSSQKASNGVEEFTPPLTFRIGMEADVLAFANAENDLTDLVVRVEGVDPRDDREALNFGGELRITPSDAAFLAVRGGWARRDAGGPSFGAGIGVNMGGLQGVVDYSYSEYGDVLGGCEPRRPHHQLSDPVPSRQRTRAGCFGIPPAATYSPPVTRQVIEDNMRIAHITDLHLRKHVPGTSLGTGRLSRRTPELLEEAVERLCSERPDVVVVTGDLVDHPFYALSTGECREEAKQDVQLIKRTVEALGCPAIIIHGNHDHREASLDALADVPRDQRIGGYRFVTFHDEEVSRNVPQRLSEERERFHAILDDDDPTPQIHIQHYVVWPRRNEGYPHTYAEADSMRERIVSSGKVRLVLSGHYHPGIRAVPGRQHLVRGGTGLRGATAQVPHLRRGRAQRVLAGILPANARYATPEGGVPRSRRHHQPAALVSLGPGAHGTAPRRSACHAQAEGFGLRSGGSSPTSSCVGPRMGYGRKRSAQ